MTRRRIARTSLIPTGKAHLAVEYIREKGVARSDEIERELGITNASALLKRHVDRGELISCQVTRPGRKGVVNEYRISAAAGMPRKGEGWRAEFALPKPPTASREDEPEAPAAPARRAGRYNGSRFVGEIVTDVPPPARGHVLSRELRERMTELAEKPAGASFVTDFSAKHCYGIAGKLGIKVTCGKDGERIRVWRRA